MCILQFKNSKTNETYTCECTKLTSQRLYRKYFQYDIKLIIANPNSNIPPEVDLFNQLEVFKTHNEKIIRTFFKDIAIYNITVDRENKIIELSLLARE